MDWEVISQSTLQDTSVSSGAGIVRLTRKGKASLLDYGEGGLFYEIHNLLLASLLST